VDDGAAGYAIINAVPAEMTVVDTDNVKEYTGWYLL